MDICNNHTFGLIIILAVVMAGIILPMINKESEVKVVEKQAVKSLHK